ncbi:MULTISPECIES: TetR/AcrR family transcriptional regulator [Agrobacterium tumefaciens complex]|uniref:TetR/AcrR family transcriptional regulator n=1 Tax=Agrobacterium tumefaciens TaxID=358 RepID=UPI000FE28FE9|nr:TetR/AcrR family transcriptional regulator [Agrobacterium tumefaciens]QAB00934.1 TetR/AcrR family transcriptional regulator [Agrobacterium tumefaciens]
MEKNLRETIIETADRLFYQHGIHAVGINRLIEESGVSKDSFYRNFRSKESLIEAYVRARHEAAMRNFLKVVARHDTPRDQISAIFSDLADRVQRHGFRGCAFIMMLAEYSDVPSLATLAREHKEKLRTEIEAICSRFSDRSAHTARILCVLYEGFLSRSAVTRTPDDREALLETVISIIRD